MKSAHSIDELPDEVFVPLGQRGMEGIPLKVCAYACDGTDLQVLSVAKSPPEITGHSVEIVTEDWHLQCKKCGRHFTIRCRNRFVDGTRLDTMVNILDDLGNDMGWLGNY